MNITDLARRIEYHRGSFANPRKLQNLCDDIVTNGIDEMIELCYKSKIIGISKIAMFCSYLDKDEQKELVDYILTKPKVKYIDLKFQEIELRRQDV